MQIRGNPLAAIKEERACEHSGQSRPNSAFKSADFLPVVVILEKLGHVLIGDGSPISALRQRRKDLLRTCGLGGFVRGLTGENPVAAGCRAEALHVKGTLKLKPWD